MDKDLFKLFMSVLRRWPSGVHFASYFRGELNNSPGQIYNTKHNFETFIQHIMNYFREIHSSTAIANDPEQQEIKRNCVPSIAV